MEDEILTNNEVAELLKIGPSRARVMIERGIIPSVRLGARTRRVLGHELQEWLHKNSSARNETKTTE